MSFFQLPTEIRLRIYSELFGDGLVYLNAGRQDIGTRSTHSEMLPTSIPRSCPLERGAQILRTCKAILFEARPILYRDTVFKASFQAFAGRLPTCISSDHPSRVHIKHIEWHLNCDLLKKFDASDVNISQGDVQALQTIKISCQAENWKDSFCGAWSDREAFVRGRQQVVDFAQLLRQRMAVNNRVVSLAEETRYLSRGRVVLRLFANHGSIAPDVSILGSNWESLLDQLT